MNSLLFLLAAKDQAGSPLSSLIILLPVGALAFYMMSVQPKKQRQKHAAFVASLEPGDEVVTSGGIHGTVCHIDGDVIEVEVDADVILRVSKASLARRTDGGAATPDAKGAPTKNAPAKGDEKSSPPTAANGSKSNGSKRNPGATPKPKKK